MLYLVISKVCQLWNFIHAGVYLTLCNRGMQSKQMATTTVFVLYCCNELAYYNITKHPFQVDPYICGHRGHFSTSCGIKFSQYFAMASHEDGNACSLQPCSREGNCDEFTWG